jgi:hypothetical protein
MSEFQYYEWQIIDRPLNPDERRAVSRLSSHMDVVTSTQAVVTYGWGDFKHDPRAVLLKYFDAGLYFSNWGSRRLMFRFPATALDAPAVDAYCLEDGVTLTAGGAFYVLDIDWHVDSEREWDDAAGILSRLISLREAILAQDYRPLYLAWLGAMTAPDLSHPGEDEHEDEPGPPLPAGLQNPGDDLTALVEFFDIDCYLVAAAAQAGAALTVPVDRPLVTALAQLTRQECEDYLGRLLNGEPQLQHVLRRRLLALTGKKPAVAQPPTPSIRQLLEVAERLRVEAGRRARAEAERRRLVALEALALREDDTWNEIVSLIERRQPRAYDDAVSLLRQLRDLAVHRHELAEFQHRCAELRRRFGNRPSLIERLRQAGLTEG